MIHTQNQQDCPAYSLKKKLYAFYYYTFFMIIQFRFSFSFSFLKNESYHMWKKILRQTSYVFFFNFYCFQLWLMEKRKELSKVPLYAVLSPVCIWGKSVYPCVCLSLCLSICLCVCLYVCLSVYLSIHVWVCLCVCLSVRPSVCLSVCLSVCW